MNLFYTKFLSIHYYKHPLPSGKSLLFNFLHPKRQKPKINASTSETDKICLNKMYPLRLSRNDRLLQRL